MKVLAVPATSASSERIFSKARLVMPWNRCRLASESLRAIMCLRDWTNLHDAEVFLNDEEYASDNDELN